MTQPTTFTRRELIKAAGLAAAGATLGESAIAAPRAPSSPVAIARCDTYAVETVTARLNTLLEQLGGIKPLVAGKTVAVKVNMVNTPADGVLGLPSGRTYQVNFNVARALAILLDRAGASRIRFLESSFSTAPVEKFFTSGGWNLREFDSLKAKVEFEDTRNMGRGKRYHRFKVPGGGMLFPAYDLNHSYEDCDVYISLAKLKNHLAGGVTLSMKNNFGLTPTSLYGQSRQDEQSVNARGEMIHDGSIRPVSGVPLEVDPNSPRKVTYRVPRHIVDMTAARPIHLAIIDGIETVSGGEGPWHKSLARQVPNLLFAGRNPVCTDSIATAVMGYNPMAARCTETFPGDNHLTLAARLGLGTNDPKQIEVRGLSIKDALHPFQWEPKDKDY